MASSSSMKLFPLIIIPAAIALVACESMNRPLDSSSSFDPLARPGSGQQVVTTSYGPNLSPGQFVIANIPNTAFYKEKPKENQDADKLLPQGTNMKIVSNSSSFLKVELDSGEVGWVPAVMVVSATPDVVPIDGTYEVYPTLPGNEDLEPLPAIDPNGLPPVGSLPTVIDPDAPLLPPSEPLKIDPIPDLKPQVPEVKPEEKAVDEKPAE
jgi:hypothetical protein